MPLLPTIGRSVGTGIKALRILVRGGMLGSVWATRRVGDARARGAANETGMIRLFDLHALSCAGDTLIAIGLAGTIFFDVPLGEARSKVALYLLITMVPFALLAPVVGPLLDHFRHGRRYALALTMLGRAFLAYVIAGSLFNWGLYPAAFGVLALSRAYGVARSAAVPRLLPDGVGLSQVGARASVYGTFAGAVVAPVGLLAFTIGPQWPLRVAAIVFLVGVVVSLRLPPRADSDPPEAVPRPFRAMLRLGRGADRPLSGSLVVNTLIGSASFRLLYGFLLLYLAFAVKAGSLGTTFFGFDVGGQGAVAVVGAALVGGTFLATAAGTRLRIRRPVALQSGGLTLTAGFGVLTAIFFSLPMVALFALVTAIFSGISKLAVDASIQERVPERLRASAFAHSETVLMIAWVVGGALGLIPLDGRLGIILAAAVATAAAVRGALVVTRLGKERLHGRPDGSADEPTTVIPTSPPPAGAATPHAPAPPGTPDPGSPRPGGAQPSAAEPGGAQPRPGEPSGFRPDATEPGGFRPGAAEPGAPQPGAAEPPRAPKRRFFSRGGRKERATTTPPQPTAAPGDIPQPPSPQRTGNPASVRPPADPWPSADPRPAADSRPPADPWPSTDPWPSADLRPPASSRPSAGSRPPAGSPAPPADDRTAPPGFHIYRPSSAPEGTSPDETSR